ncbi:MAG: hypothetical protein R3288_16125, partial [Woeseiaceae bacterium]|nr:hypothetical protein [Woeseiaceae bacterium]
MRLLLVALIFAATQTNANDYLNARAELIAAYESEDYVEMQAAAERALAARPGHAGALYNLAFAQVLNDQPESALSTLEKLLAQRVDFGVAGNEAFAALKSLPRWPSYEARVAALYEPVGRVEVIATHDVTDFIPEGIAVAGDTVYLGSIRHGTIVRLGEVPEVIAEAADGPHWSVFGMRLSGNRLWYVSSAIAEFDALVDEDAGKNGLFAIDLDSGDVVVSALLPANERRQVLGDLVFIDDGTVMLADQADGIVYRYSIADGEFSEFVPRGAIGSPQGMVVDASGEHVYVADYIGGLFRVGLDDGSVEKIGAPETISLYGIDGLYRYGGCLVAIQNGLRPNRVIAMELSDDGLQVTGARILAMNLAEFDE